MRPLLSLIGITICVIYSCSPVYIPNALNVPVLTDKRSFNGSFGFARSGIDLQLAYAVTDHIGVMANSSIAQGKDDAVNTANFHNHLFFEGGVGYSFQPASNLVFEAYGGFGSGKIKSKSSGYHFFKPEGEFVNATMQRFFVQPSISYREETFELGFATRVSFVNIKPWELKGGSSGYDCFIEPVIFSKLGIRNIKVIFQLGFSSNTDSFSWKKDSYFSNSNTSTEPQNRFASAVCIYSLSWQLSFGGRKLPVSNQQTLDN